MMRELTECTEEVFRRSEKRIQARKRSRNRILMGCIPLLLCITVFSAAVLPAMTPPGKSNDKAVEEKTEISELDGSIACAFYSVTICNPATGDCRQITDKQTVDRMSFAIFHVCDTAPESQQIADTSKTADFTFTFKAGDGVASVYHLTGNTLFSVETGQTISLSDEQLADLTEVFELPN